MIIKDNANRFFFEVKGSDRFEFSNGGVTDYLIREELAELRDMCDRALNVSQDELDA